MIKNILAAALGVLTTIFLVKFMIEMIQYEPIEIPKNKPVKIELQSFIEPPPPVDEQEERELPEKTETVHQPEIFSVPPLDVSPTAEIMDVPIEIPGVAAPVDFNQLLPAAPGRPGMGSNDSDASPIVQIEPRYPSDVAASGAEGFVLLSYSVQADGSVADVKILDADPKRVFNRAARQALSKWRYRPKLIDGRAVTQEGLTIRLEFKLES